MAFIFDDSEIVFKATKPYDGILSNVEKGRVRFLQGGLLGIAIAGAGCFYYRKYKPALDVLEKVTN